MATPPSAAGSKPVVTLPEAVEIAIHDMDGDGKIDVVYGATKGGTIHDFHREKCSKSENGKFSCRDKLIVLAELRADQNGQDFSVRGTGLFASGTIARAQQLIGKDFSAVKRYEQSLASYRKHSGDLQAFEMVRIADEAGLRTSVPQHISQQARQGALRLLAQLVGTEDPGTLNYQGTTHFQQASRVLALTGGEVKFAVDGTTYSSLAQIRDKVFENMGGEDSNTAKAFLAVANRAIQGSQTPPRATATEE